MGLFHPLADAIKMLTKEDFRPARADRFLFWLAPFVSVFFALVAFASIPFGDTLRIGEREIPLQAVTLNVGVLYVFAMLSLGVYGVMMAGWSSANNFALLGGQRAAALMISAEIAIGASIMGVIMVYGSLNMQDIVRGQGTLLWGWLPPWGIVTQPLAFVLFLTAGIAATKRIPFDTPESESEIIGYFVEYSGMKFGMFVMADFLETVVIAGMTTALFLGGWQVPYLLADGFHFPWRRHPGRCRTCSWWLLQVGGLRRQGLRHDLHPDAGPVDAPALPLRSGHAPGLARPLPALHPQHRGDGGGAAPGRGEALVRLGQRFYLLEAVRGWR